MMVNQNTNQQHGLFGFPFFTPPQPQQTVAVDVEDKEKELIIVTTFSTWKKENISVEVVRNGIFLSIQEKKDVEEDSEQDLPSFNEQRFFPINFPFTEEDVMATFDEKEEKLTIRVQKNDANRKFIRID